jgi:flagellar biosynthesis protein FlhB
MAEKTEAPTPRHKEEARNKGQGVGRSAEFSMGLTLGVGTLALSALLPGVAAQLVTRTQTAIIDLPSQASNAQLVGETGGAILTVLILILPLACLVMIAGVGGQVISGGLVFSPKAIRFDLSRINPLKGIKRIADKQALVRLGLSSAKLAILAFMSYQVVGSRIPMIVNSQGMSAAAIAGTCLAAIFQLGLTITILLAVVALVDFVVQRRRAMESIKMTKEEVKQEFKESEGNPQMRGARRRRARQMAFARMMDAVPTSDVIVTNPTTLAVALKYDSLTMRAPRIVAKGQRLMADRIKAVAREHNVPVVEDKPLARALFSRPIGSEVPTHLFRAVARLLVLVHQARFGAGRAAAGRRASRGWSPQGPGGAAGGSAAQPWWNAATRPAAGAVLDPERNGGPATLDSSAATRLYGTSTNYTSANGTGSDRAARPELEDDVDMDAGDSGDMDDAWLGSAALKPGDVDEDALAVAMAEDELSDMTPEELAELEAGLERQPGRAVADVLDEDSTNPDAEEPDL